MTRILALSTIVALPALAQIPAFPGAEGFGAYAAGGRGGDVYYVTTLNNNGAGSLREGLNTAPAAGRTIVFAVSGYIPVSSDTNFNVPSNVTIAGQTAPGDGVGLRGGRMLVSGSNVVMRHFRIRHGRNGTGGDCLNIASSASSTMLDHISMMFSTDENFSFFNSSVNNFTMQYSNTSWGMERHNAGGLWDLQNGSCHHTLWAHHRTRNPKARPNGVLEWINNVTFHWRGEPFIMGDSQSNQDWKANVRGCYYISIDDPDDGFGIKNTALVKARIGDNGTPNFSLYLDDTLFDNDDDGLVDGTDRGYDIVSGSEFDPSEFSPPSSGAGQNRYAIAATPFAGSSGLAAVTLDDPTTAYKKVISAGSPLRLDANYSGPLRDELDTLLVDSVVNQYSVIVQKDGKIAGEDPSRPNNGEQHLADAYGITNNGFGTLNGTAPPTDSDLDGMPDFWELALNGANGISYNVVGDDHNNVFTGGQLANTFFPAGTPTGYTFLEEYLHFKAVPHASMAKSTTGSPSVQTVDLAKYADAFSNTPVFTITNVKNGTVQQFLPNGITPSATGPVLKFTPSTEFVGRAGFDFNVTDAEGSSWTQQFALLVTNNAAPRDLVWIGGGNDWDYSTSNWQTSSGVATTYGSGDTALFDDRGSASPAVDVVEPLFTGSILVTGTQPYTFSGSGNIGSTGSLTKASDSDLTIAVPTTFSSGTFLNGGNTIINDGGNIGGDAIQFTGGSTLTDNTGSNYLTIAPDIQVSTGAVGNLTLSSRADLNGSLSGGGTFNIFSPSNLGTEGRVYFKGASAGCTGTVNISGGATSPGNGGRIAFYANGGAFNGFDNARVNLSGVSLFPRNNSFGNTYNIGSLSGDANAVIVGPYIGGEATWDVGGLGLDSEFAGTISDGLSSVNNLNKYGSGKLTLSGDNTYSGGTAIYGGTLEVLGSLGNTDVFVGGGAKLCGSGPVGNLLTIQQDSEVSPGNSPGEVGTMTTTGGITLNPATLTFDLSSNPASGNDQILNSSGTLIFNSPGGNLGAHFDINLLDGFLGEGTYNLILGGTGTSAPGSPAFTHNLPDTTRQSFSLQRSGGGSSDAHIRLVVTGTPGDLTWTGSNGANWNLNSTANFSGGPSGDNRFYNLDRVSFADGAATGSVNLVGTLQPREVLVDNTTSYVLNGASGSIGGGAMLTKSGSGTLTISPGASGNDYSGGTNLTNGTLSISGNSPLGTGPVHVSGGTLNITSSDLYNSMVFSNTSALTTNGNTAIVGTNSNTMTSIGDASVDLSGVGGLLTVNGDMSGLSGTLDFGAGSGTLRMNWNGSANDDRNFGSATTLFDLGTASAVLNNRNGDKTIYLGGLEGGPGTRLEGRQTGAGPTTTTYVVGALNTDNTFDGTITDAGDDGGVFIVKVGNGTWTLGGSSNYIGALAVDEGTLALSGSITSTLDTSVGNGATLEMAGGTLGSPSSNVAAGGTLQGFGMIDGELVNDGFVDIDSNSLTVSGTVINNGVMRLTNGAQLVANQAFENYGVLDLLTSGSGLPPKLQNFGTVIETGGLELTGFGIDGNDVDVSMMIYEGHSYRLYWSPDLSTDSWTPVGDPVSGNGAEHTFTHINGATATRRFYRVTVTP